VAASGPIGSISDGSNNAPAISSNGANHNSRRTSRRCGLNDGGRALGLKRFFFVIGADFGADNTPAPVHVG
jgi:hypothetical protein